MCRWARPERRPGLHAHRLVRGERCWARSCAPFSMGIPTGLTSCRGGRGGPGGTAPSTSPERSCPRRAPILPAPISALRRAGGSAVDWPPPPGAHDGARGEGGARRDGGDELFGGTTAMRGPLARAYRTVPEVVARPGGHQVLQRLPTSSPSKSSPQAPLVDLHGTRPAGALRGEPPVVLSQERRAGASTRLGSEPSSTAGVPRHPARLYATATRAETVGPDDVRRRDVAAAGPVAHDLRPRHHGHSLESRVAVLDPRLASSWPGCRCGFNCTDGMLRYHRAPGASAICRRGARTEEEARLPPCT